MHNHALVMVRGSRFALVTCEAGEAALARVYFIWDWDPGGYFTLYLTVRVCAKL